MFISTQEQEQLISVITKIFELEKYTIVRKGFYAVAFVTDNPKLAFLSEPNSQGVVVWWFLSFAKMAYSPSINTRLIEAYEKLEHVDPV